MVTKIIEAIYQMKLPIPKNLLENTNVYLIRGKSGGCTLIDTGWGNNEVFNALSRQLEEIGVGFKDITQIIITHAHFDHFGLAGKVKQLSGAKLFLHRNELELFRTRYTVTKEYMHQREQWFVANGVPPPMAVVIQTTFAAAGKPTPAQPDILLDGGETIDCDGFKLRVVWTPGHSPGHICPYDAANKLLFAGDHILPVITPNISLPAMSETNPLGEFLKSLNSLKNLEVSRVLPAHEAIFNNLSQRIDEIIHHHEMRTKEILGALDGKCLTAFDISNVITWMPELEGVKFTDLEPADKRSAVSETLAHLRAMTIDHKVSHLKQDGIVYYQRIC